MLSLPTDKAAARAVLRRARKELTDAYRRQSSLSLCSHALEAITVTGAESVLLFAPIGDEPDILPLAKELLGRGASVFFPVSLTEETKLEFHRVTELSELCVGAYGIREPSRELPLFRDSESAVCIVPALAFDRRGMRIGYGKGYYDRFLSTFGGKRFGVVYSQMLFDKLPADKYDIPVDMIITEGGTVLPDETA